MFGSGKRKRELALAAKNATAELLEEAIFEACLSGYHPHPLYVVCLLGLQARAGAGALPNPTQ